MLEDIRPFIGEWDRSALPPNVRIGKDCYLERSDAFRRFFSERTPGLVLGDRVKAYSWTSFSVEPDGFVEVGDDSVLVGALFMCGERITVGANVVISYLVSIADSDFHPHDGELRKLDAIANAPDGDRSRRPPYPTRPVVIEDDVQIGMGAFVLKGVRIGAGATVHPGSIVTSDVPPGVAVAGNPARVIGDNPA